MVNESMQIETVISYINEGQEGIDWQWIYLLINIMLAMDMDSIKAQGSSMSNINLMMVDINN